MNFQLPPIARVAERLLLEIEQAVRAFPRYHRYTVGAELRTEAMALAVLTHRAWRDRANQVAHVRQLVWAIDAFKLRLQLASQVRAFASFAQFEQIYRTTRELGQQAGGWRKQQSPVGQNAPARQRPAAARPDTEYSRRPSHSGANP
jgi:hypothetical protein